MFKFLFIVFLSVYNIYSQESSDLEIFCQTESVSPSSSSIVFKIEPVVDFVQYDRVPYPDWRWRVVNNASAKTTEITGNYIGYINGFDCIFSDDNPVGNTYWITLNKITIINLYDFETFYFFINYYDSELGASHSSDFTIRFVGGGSYVGIWYHDGPSMNPITNGFTRIENGDTLTIWDIQGYTNTTATFELWTTISIQNNHPYLSWNPFNNIDFTATNYEVWRGQSPDGNNPPLSYSLLATVNASTHSYVDNQLTIGGSSKYFYKVRAKNSTQYSLYGNKVTTKAMVSEKLVISNIIKANNFSLSQNHPNPFNPTTTIVYQTPIAGIVNLSVYNLLGEKIATPVNDYKEAGEYTLQFNASGLPSGTYIYTLTTNGKKISKKLS